MKIQILKTLFLRAILLLSFFSLTSASSLVFAHGSHQDVVPNSLSHFLLHFSPYALILLLAVIGYRLWKKHAATNH